MVRVCMSLVAAFLVFADVNGHPVVAMAADGLRPVSIVADGAGGAQQVIVSGAPAGVGQVAIPMPPPPPPPIQGAAGMPSRDASARTGTARIRGRVVAADSGAPLRKAQVRAAALEIRENRLATTDAQGNYEFKDLPGGRYILTASKGSYVSLQYGQTRPLEQGKPLELRDGQSAEKMDFSLPRGSVITGRIVDEFGDPASDVMVMPMRYQFTQGRRRLAPVGRSSMTNDLGEYRIFGLPPGQYYLSATMRGGGGMVMSDTAASDDRSGYAPTYYPGTPNIAEAQRINVPIGQAVNDLNMALVQTRTARISGTAVDSSGKPLSGGFLMIMQRSGPMVMSSGASQIRPDGSFTIANVAPGEYTLTAQAPGGMPGDPGESATALVTVTGEDITGLQLAGTRMITATGRLVIDPQAAKSFNVSTLRITTSPMNPDLMMMGGGGGRVNDDLTFEIRTRPGLQLVRLLNMAAANGWMTKAVRYNGVDITDSGYEFRPNEDISGIEIELTNHPSELSGLVTTRRGEPSKDYTVVVFAQDPQRWGYQSRYIATGRPDQDGRFKIRNLPAGAYFAVALEYVEPGESSDPEFLERVKDLATPLSLNEGDARTIELKIQGT